MEDYAAACVSRRADVEALLAAPNRRTTAAVHLGGVAVECQVKALIVGYHRLNDWGEISKRPNNSKDPIRHPGHGLIAGMRLMRDIWRKAKADHYFLEHLNRLQHPQGTPNVDYIDLRYSGDEQSEAEMKDWERSFSYVCGWLRKNEDKSL